MYNDSIKKQTFIYATPTSCNNNQENVIVRSLDNDEQFLVTHKPVLWATPTFFEPKQV